MAPETQAPAEYLKHPCFLATTGTERSDPPIMAPSNPKGEEGPKSTTKPVFLDELCQVTVVPTFTQKGAFPLAFGMLGVEETASAVRLTSTEQGSEADPHVLPALHICSGFVSVQIYLPLACSSPTP